MNGTFHELVVGGVSNATPSTQGLPGVDAVYTWVRLAQRVPVRIRITEVPPGVPLVSGLTATVTVRRRSSDPSQGGPFGALAAGVRDAFAPPPPAPDCIPALKGGTGPAVAIPDPRADAFRTPEQIDPGLATGLTFTPGRP